MRYFSANEILFSLFLSIVFGITSGGLYKSAVCVTSGIRNVFRAAVSAWSASSIFDFKEQKAEQKSKKVIIKQNAFDFFFFIIFGILYIFLCYVTLDGVFRIYMLIFVAASFFISKITLGALFERVINFVFKILKRLVFVISYILTLPLKAIFKLIIRLMSPPINRLRLYLKKRKSIRIADKKYRDAAVFLKKLT